MYSALVSLVLAVFSLLGYRPTQERRAIALALVDAELEVSESAPAYTSHTEDLVHQAFFVVRESSLDNSAVGDGGKAHGIFQLHGPCGLASYHEQAHCWRILLAKSPCHDHPVAVMWGQCTGRINGSMPVEMMAAGREARARELLWQALDVTSR